MSKPRAKARGTHNIVGYKVEQKRRQMGLRQHELMARLQNEGMDITESGMSRLEGQMRAVQDFEIRMLCKVLGVSLEWLLGMESDER